MRIPIAVKLAPYFSSLPHMAAELVRAGADGLVLFNRFYAPDIDLATLRVTRSLPLSTAAELPLSLVWIALLSRRLECSLAASRGVETRDRGREVPARRRRRRDDDLGPAAARTAAHRDDDATGSSAGSSTNRFDSVDAIRGLKDATHVEDVDAFLRAQYVAALTEYLPGKLVQ